MKSKRFVRWGSIGAVLLAPALPLFLYFHGNWYSFFHSYSLGMAFGILSYGWFLNSLILAARLRWVDRLFGHDRVMAFHGWLALGALASAALHYLFKRMYFPQITTQSVWGGAALALLSTVIALTLLFMVDLLAVRIPLLGRVKRWAGRTRWLDYSHLKLFHNLTALAALGAAVHVLMAAATAESYTRMWIMGGWAGLALGLFLYHKLIRVALLYRRGVRVTGVERLTDTITAVRMTPRRPFAHRAGQFVFVRFLSPDPGVEEHPFTLSSPPLSPQIVITAKHLGDYSARMHAIAPGCRALVDGPYGVFTPRQDGSPHLFIAGGIGITPFLSICTQWAHEGITHPCTLVWSVHSPEELVERELLESIARTNPLFRFVPVVTAHPDPAQRRRIDADLLDAHLKGGEPRSASIWYCGPRGLREVIVTYARRAGIPRRTIHYELFSF